MSRVKVTREQMKALGLTVPTARRPKGPKIDDQARRTLFLAACKAHGLPMPIPEFRFAPPRKWMFDWVWEAHVALEIQGGLFVQGRHSRGAALLDEHEKLNEAACRGFRVLFCTPQDIETGAIFPTIKRALVAEEEGV